MAFKQELVLPAVGSSLTASDVAKTATAATFFNKSTPIVKDEDGMLIFSFVD